VDTVVLTGATSGLGGQLVTLLRGQNVPVVALVRSSAGMSAARALGAEPVMADLDDLTSLPDGVAGTMVHAAGVRFAQAARILAEKWGVSAGVCISSASATVPGHPLSELVASHEQALLSSDVRWHMIRPTMIFGWSRDRNVRKLARLILSAPAVPRLRGGGRIQPVFVDDVAAAAVELATRASAGDNVLPPVVPYGGLRPMRVGDLVEDLRVELGVRRLPVSVPVALLSRAAHTTRLDRTGRFGHAVSMLTTSRVVPDPTAVGLSHQPTDWSTALRIAVGRYGMARSPQSPGSDM